MKAELFEKEELYRKLLMTVPDIIVRTDLSGTIVYVNENAFKLYSFLSPGDLLGKNMLSFMAEEDLERAKQNTRLMFDHPLGPVEYHLKINKELDLYCEVNGDVLLDAQDQPAGMVYVIRDIGKRKEAEEALRESEERYKNFLSQISEAVFRLEVRPPMPLSLETEEQIDYLYDHAVLAECNQALLDMYRVERESDLIGKTMLEFHGGRNNPQNREAIREFVRSGYNVQGKITEEPDSQGNVRIYRNNALGIVENGLLVRSWSTQADITEQYRAEMERERLQAQLQQAQKMESVGRLAGGVAHDFNNMLGVILGYTDMSLGKIDADHPLSANLMKIRRAAERSANLTRQLLAFARKQTIAPRVLDLNETVEGMLEMLGRLIGEDIELAWLPGPSLWPVRVDPSQIDQILANLCVNAKDAISCNGRITIETDNFMLEGGGASFFSEDQKTGPYVRLTVSDNGCGMDQNVQAHLFEPFFTTKETGKGTGLGLATVYGVVKQNGGYISIYSELEMGTSVKIYFPAQDEPPDHKPSALKPEPRARGQGTILLVEDEPAILEMTALMLREFGYTVLSAATPGPGLELARRHECIDLLITDVVMPGMNGKELARSLLELHPRMKGIFMSGYTAEVIAHHGVLEPDVQFINKPFSIEELAAKVNEVLS